MAGRTRPPRRFVIPTRPRAPEYVRRGIWDSWNTSPYNHIRARGTSISDNKDVASPSFPGIPEPHYPVHDRTVVVTSCGRLCLFNKKINLSVSLAGQAVGVKEVDHGMWLVSFMDYDLGYIDLEEKTLQPLDNPFAPRVSPVSPERSVTHVSGTDTF